MQWGILEAGRGMWKKNYYMMFYFVCLLLRNFAFLCLQQWVSKYPITESIVNICIINLPKPYEFSPYNRPHPT